MTHRHVLHEFMTGQTEELADCRRNLWRDIAIAVAVALVLWTIMVKMGPSARGTGDLSAFAPRNRSCSELAFDRHYFKCGLLRSRTSTKP